MTSKSIAQEFFAAMGIPQPAGKFVFSSFQSGPGKPMPPGGVQLYSDFKPKARINRLKRDPMKAMG